MGCLTRNGLSFILGIQNLSDKTKECASLEAQLADVNKILAKAVRVAYLRSYQNCHGKL